MEPIDLDKKRPRDEFTESIVKEVLAEESQAKKAKKGGPAPGAGAGARKGKTLAEIEDEEGGPVKESMVSMAQTKRRMARKGAAAGEGPASSIDRPALQSRPRKGN